MMDAVPDPGGPLTYGFPTLPGLAIKNPPKKTPKNPPKKTHRSVFLGFFKFLIFYENNTNFSLWNRFFYEQIRSKLSFIYKKIVRYALNCSIKNISERNKIETQSRADAYIRRKRLISKSDYNLKSGCT
jgi:hypothetical protein